MRGGWSGLGPGLVAVFQMMAYGGDHGPPRKPPAPVRSSVGPSGVFPRVGANGVFPSVRVTQDLRSESNR